MQPAAGEPGHLDVAEDDRVLGGGRLPREAQGVGAEPLVHLLAHRQRGVLAVFREDHVVEGTSRR